MRLAVFGASGQIGAQVVDLLTAEGHDVVGASRRTGVDVLTGEGVADALSDAHVLVDVLNSPSYEDEPVLEFFGTATRVLVTAAQAAGVAHYVALSIVGVTRLRMSGYMRAKVAQETLIEASGLPYTIVRATQFDEFADMIVTSLTDGDVVRVPDARIQPIAAAEVAAHVARAAVGSPAGVVELGGPDKITFAELARVVLARRGEHRTVVVDPEATYFGARVDADSLVTGTGAVLGSKPFAP
ncbi:SDR family oxidoreductase [Mycobacterium sp. CVI_P3]|uniref:SDR family oxidoreductase n=1 Tax=Mycobacterium pinniadriaticum TaxID=2994102 RepID=A0ABT3SPA8_9MYCO|nr:SDR family oxidoreductase [Mycobacterium pinniadriaticum]MCX2934205.1 SDR family oxidoreductase [Mycobacterium pinniadriaticum]MCX2940627.1 SDR family oxidoreductase [Mycobacterium pinniadriaticum]